MADALSSLRQRLWRAYQALKVPLRRLQRSQPMVQGSLYMQERRCGKPNCRCAQGHLHAAWVVARSEAGKSRTYMVPASERRQLRQWTAQYRRYQRARAALVKQHVQILQLVDELAEKQMMAWPSEEGGGEPR